MVKRVPICIRWPEEVDSAMRASAEARMMSLTEWMRNAALGYLSAPVVERKSIVSANDPIDHESGYAHDAGSKSSPGLRGNGRGELASPGSKRTA
jgi:hypothetical protein